MWKDISDLNTAIDEFEPVLLALYSSKIWLLGVIFQTSECQINCCMGQFPAQFNVE